MNAKFILLLIFVTFSYKNHLSQVTPAGFAQMTHMLSGLSHGKLLVILEGGLVV